MKTCNNCLWNDRCPNSGKRCEDYYPVIGCENIVLREYELSLKERVEEYEEIVKEQQE